MINTYSSFFIGDVKITTVNKLVVVREKDDVSYYNEQVMDFVTNLSNIMLRPVRYYYKDRMSGRVEYHQTEFRKAA